MTGPTREAVGWATPVVEMPYAHESVNPARHARACAWLRAALRLLRKGLTDSSLQALSGYARKGKKALPGLLSQGHETPTVR
jgi:hypothetical protein